MLRTSINLAGICLTAAFVVGSISSAEDSEEQAIHMAYKAWVKAANEKNIAKWSVFLADDPYFVPADSHPLTSAEEVIEYYKRLFSDSLFSLDCEQEKVEVADSGDMAWARGRCNATFTGPGGKKASGTSRWVKVWIKHLDGSWRGRVNMWKYVDKP